MFILCTDTCNTSVYQARDAILKLASGITDIAVIATLFDIILTEYYLTKVIISIVISYNKYIKAYVQYKCF